MESVSFDPYEVQKKCNGMLSPEVYRAMYEAARAAPMPFIVEVGTAHAAGTVSLALGLRDSGRKGHVYTFEKIVGGSREKFGGVNENVHIIEENIAAFGVSDIVKLIVGDVADRAFELPQEGTVGLLCLDADGAIDRDFQLFYSRLDDEAIIIVDDVANYTRVKQIGRNGLRRKLRIDQKHCLTYRLLELFRRLHLVNDGEIVLNSNTWFGRKGSGQLENLTAEDIIRVYRSLIFTDAALSPISIRERVGPLLQKNLPVEMFRWLRTVEQRIKAR